MCEWKFPIQFLLPFACLTVFFFFPLLEIREIQHATSVNALTFFSACQQIAVDKKQMHWLDQRRMTSPVFPFIWTRSPFFNVFMSPLIPSTAGIPNSLATIAAWESIPPYSTRQPLHCKKSGVHDGSVVTVTKISPFRSWEDSVGDVKSLTGPLIIPAETPVPWRTLSSLRDEVSLGQNGSSPMKMSATVCFFHLSCWPFSCWIFCWNSAVTELMKGCFSLEMSSRVRKKMSSAVFSDCVLTNSLAILRRQYLSTAKSSTTVALLFSRLGVNLR